MKMSKRIFRMAILVAFIVLIASTAFIMGILYDFFEKQLENELASEAQYVSFGIDKVGMEYLDGFESSDGNRITVIAPDGEVLADTAADPSSLGNHSDREEVQEALETGTGMSIRYSDTITERTVYYATLMDDGNVLRVCAVQYSVFAALLNLLWPVTVVTILAIILSLILSDRAAKRIVRPINALNLDEPEKNETYEELTPLLKKIATQRREIDKQLESARHKQEEFILITENMSEGFLVIDNETNVLTYNSAALSLLGISREQVNGSVLVLNRAKDFRYVVEKALEGDRAESEMPLGDKTYRLIANPVYENSKIIGAVILILDITESAERERLRREFTSNVSHELKTPLTSISGFAEMMMGGGVPEATVIDFSKSIYDEAKRLITLVNDIIKISELDDDTAVFEKENVDLYELASDIVKRLKPQADKKHVTIDLSGEPAEVYGVDKILDEMIYNLADNAIKYNKDGGNVKISVVKSSDKVMVTVSDNGIGIPKQDINRVFERFYSVDKSHSKLMGGTGLGLSIVKHGAMYHKAEIYIESEEGVGTSISIEFPVGDESSKMQNEDTK